MAVTQLQQRGLENCPDFKTQVLGIVEYQALEYNKQYQDALDANQRQLLSRVQQEPGNYGFVSAIVTDGDWSLTFDAWAADTAAAGSLILTGVKTWFTFCTNFVPPEAVVPE
jgi:alkaline phosphatase